MQHVLRFYPIKLCKLRLNNKIIVQLKSDTMRSVLILDDTKIEVLAQSDRERVAVFYPINDPVTTAQIVAVDMCNQRSDPTTIQCTLSTPGG